MNFRQLKAFDTVMRLGSITGRQRRFMSHNQVSRAWFMS